MANLWLCSLSPAPAVPVLETDVAASCAALQSYDSSKGGYKDYSLA